MNKNQLLFTAGQFALLHHLNKRTLHYYDDIGLFSPAYKGDNGYRYYTYYQSAELENIRSLRELNMSIDEIKSYLRHPTPQGFMEISGAKIEEIGKNILLLEKQRSVLKKKQEMLSLSMKVKDGQIDLITCEEEYLMVTPVAFEAQQVQNEEAQMDLLLKHLQAAWDLNHYKSGCGSLISVEKISQGEFDRYDGLFTEIETPGNAGDVHIKPAGRYLRGFAAGSWKKLPQLYQDMLEYAVAKKLKLFGFAYETGLNEVALADMEEYVTQILIPCRA